MNNHQTQVHPTDLGETLGPVGDQPTPTLIEWTGNIEVHHPIKEQPWKPQR